MGIPHIFVKCDVSGPALEADIVKKVVEKHPVDAVILGGTGLQVTQIKSVQDALLPLGIETFAAHAGFEHGELIEDMIKKGYKIMITQYAAEGINEKWLGKMLNKESFGELKLLSAKYGFHIGGDGSAFDTFVVGCPLFKKRIKFLSMQKYKDGKYSGYLVADSPVVIEKFIQKSL